MKTTQDIYPTFTETQILLSFSGLPKTALNIIERARRGEIILFEGKDSVLKQNVVCESWQYNNRVTCIPRIFRKLKVVSI